MSVPPEVATLHDLAFDVTEEGWESCSATSCVSVEHAEAAVLACEQRMRQQVHFLPAAPLDAETTELAFIEGIAFVNAAKHEQTVDLMRVRTVREIVAELRAIASDFRQRRVRSPGGRRGRRPDRAALRRGGIR